MARARRALVLVALLLAPGTPSAAAPASARLVAGAASVTIDLPSDTPLGGYGGFPRRAWIPDVLGAAPDTFWFRPSTGVHDPIKVRALVLEAAGVRLLWLSLDVVGMDPSLVADLRRRLDQLGLRYAAVVAAATHTHSGPGAFARSSLFEFLALDRESPRVRGRIASGMEAAARQAERRKRPATVGTGRSEVTGITASRVDGPLDHDLGVLKVTGADGRPVAVVWNYAIHGTALGRGNLQLSGDVMGDAGARIEEQLGVPALFLNGSVGDTSPRRRGWDGVASGGKALAAAVVALWPRIPADRDQRLEAVAVTALLPPPGVELRNCSGAGSRAARVWACGRPCPPPPRCGRSRSGGVRGWRFRASRTPRWVKRSRRRGASASRTPSWPRWPTPTRDTSWRPNTSGRPATSRARASTGSGAGSW
jgi:hypothetical protein